jgi:hypothetical protein
MLIVCMPRIKLSYIRSECKHRIPMSLLYRILLQKLITSPERTKQRNGPHLAGFVTTKLLAQKSLKTELRLKSYSVLKLQGLDCKFSGLDIK